jgi:hypothetical protein
MALAQLAPGCPPRRAPAPSPAPDLAEGFTDTFAAHDTGSGS